MTESRTGSTSFLLKRWKRLRRLLYPLPLVPLEKWAMTLSDPACERWAKHLGSLAYWTLSKARTRALDHLHKAFGQTLSDLDIERIARETFQNLAFNALEFARFPRIGPERFMEKIEVVGGEHVEEVHQGGRGGIFVTGHIGNWELCASCLKIHGYTLNAIARRIYLAPLDRKLVEMRKKMGVTTLYRNNSMRTMLRCLQKNEFLAILPDQDVRRIGGIFVDFFGHPAYTPIGPALLALASGAPLLIARAIRLGSRHRITIDPPIYADRNASREKEIERLVTLYTKRLEAFIREHPSQWVWTHRRWRTQPSDLSPMAEGAKTVLEP
jgi:Kdo2-lipid IVA lauroyltransferase/acyltransferase